MAAQRTLKEYEELVGKISTLEEFQESGVYITQSKFGAFIGTEVEQIAQDGISESAEKLILRLRAPDGELIAKMNKVKTKEDLDKFVSTYLRRCITNYCNTRLRNWTRKDENGRSGPRSRYNNITVVTNNTDNSGSSLDTWDYMNPLSFDAEGLDIDKLETILANSGASNEDIGLLKERFGGMKYTEMALRYGGDKDKYRKKIQRLMEKIRLSTP
jgi:DNA-directed RNA polymerase specialized sigma24 family protein